MPYFPYQEPRISVILSLSSFLLSLNGIRHVLDRLLFSGIIGEILIGIIWGLPIGGTAWLSEGGQETIQALGYLGLLGLVFEGGLGTDHTLLRATAYMSVSVATIGLLIPIALSFLLLVIPFHSSSTTAYPTPLAAFSAGASLCSTSLGTTFAILSSSNMQHTRVGAVLVGAAMMDDIVGLAMVNIVTTLGKGGTTGWPIARPIAASFGLLLVTLIVAPFVLRPTWRWLLEMFDCGNHQDVAPSNSKQRLQKTLAKLIRSSSHLDFILSTLVLIIFVAVASFIDASLLLAAFIAGAVLNFLWAVRTDQQPTQPMPDGGPSRMYKRYYKPLMDFALVPFFFASIGFSIPITDMFGGSIVWKGILYSILMVLAKGLVSTVIYFEYFVSIWWKRIPIIYRRVKNTPPQAGSDYQLTSNPAATSYPSSTQDAVRPAGPPHLIALLVGSAMISRGEIGFLIASLSQSSGTLTLRHKDGSSTESSGEEIFLIIVWAVVLCTITGPLGVGIIVKRLRLTNSYAAWI